MNEKVRAIFETVKEKSIKASRKVESAVNTAGKKTGEFIETAKINLQIVELNTKVKDIYRAIGELVYKTHKDPNTDTECVDEMLAEIDAIQAEIRDLKERYYAVKQQNLCKSCGHELGKTDAFCRFCGGRASGAVAGEE